MKLAQYMNFKIQEMVMITGITKKLNIVHN